MSPSTKTPDAVKDPRRILLLAPSDAAATAFLKDLTGTTPTPPTTDSDVDGTLAGTTHVLPLKTAYYTADVPIWIDVVPASGAREWADEFSGTGAAEVRAAVGGYVVLVEGEGRGVEEVLKQVGRVVSVAEGEGWEGVSLGVVVGGGSGDGDASGEEGWVEGWEVVDAAAKGKNEFGELVGLERVREALEANEWSGGDGEVEVEELEEELGIKFGDEDGGFEIGEDEVEALRRPIFGGDEGEEEGVEEMEALMLKMQAMRDLGADMPEAERKKFAAKAVRDLMKTL